MGLGPLSQGWVGSTRTCMALRLLLTLSLCSLPLPKLETDPGVLLEKPSLSKGPRVGLVGHFTGWTPNAAFGAGTAPAALCPVRQFHPELGGYWGGGSQRTASGRGKCSHHPTCHWGLVAHRFQQVSGAPANVLSP